MTSEDVERIAKAALRELGLGDPPLTITKSDSGDDQWRIVVGGREPQTLTIRAGSGTSATFVLEQIVSQFSGR